MWTQNQVTQKNFNADIPKKQHLLQRKVKTSPDEIICSSKPELYNSSGETFCDSIQNYNKNLNYPESSRNECIKIRLIELSRAVWSRWSKLKVP